MLARVVEQLGAITYVTPNEIEGLFAADLAFLQEFYSVVNFGDQESYEALLKSAQQPLVVSAPKDTVSNWTGRSHPRRRLFSPNRPTTGVSRAWRPGGTPFSK